MSLLTALVGASSQLNADLRYKPDHQGVAHHERAPAVGHARVGPVIREAVEPLELEG